MRPVCLLALVAVLTACGTAPDQDPEPPPLNHWTYAPAPVPAPARTDGGWQVTVYYTAVQKYHHGTPRTVTGCRGLNCAHGTADLGSYPADFVAAVQSEGTGLTTAGPYLNWSY